jgi:hypothetical protein
MINSCHSSNSQHSILRAPNRHSLRTARRSATVSITHLVKFQSTHELSTILGSLNLLERAKSRSQQLFWGKVARLTGLEPATPGVTGRYSNQLSYNRATFKPRSERAWVLGGGYGNVKRFRSQFCDFLNTGHKPMKSRQLNRVLSILD